jgi:hypothetical protein
MINGASYTLVVSDATGGTYALSSADIATWKCIPACPSNQFHVTGGADTVLSIFKAGTVGYVSWLEGF